MNSVYLSTIAYFIIFNFAIMTLTVALHEIGHLNMGLSYNCRGKVVLIDPQGEGTYTILECDQPVSEKLLAMGAFIFTIPFSLIFLLLGKLPEKRFFFVVLGLIISTASLDVAQIFNINQLVIPLNIIGVALILYGEILLVKERVVLTETIIEII